MSNNIPYLLLKREIWFIEQNLLKILHAIIIQINPKTEVNNRTTDSWFVCIKTKTPSIIKNTILTINNRKFIIPNINSKLTKVFM